MAEEDSVILSFGGSFLRKSDLDLLTSPNRINDRLIGFCFEYFEREQFNHSADRIALVSPSVAQFVIFASVEDLLVLLEPLHLPIKQYIFVPVSNNFDAQHVGKAQWSLLVYVRSKQEFQHYDAHRGTNQSWAKKLVDKLQPFVQAPRSKLQFVEMDFPQQETISDSGVYVIALVEHLIKEFCECFSVSVNEVVNQEIVQHKRKQIQDLIQELSACDINFDHYLST
uniref:Ubiquitin-like protease family profile domain-containing protein n=1 Tax=Arion vulgaris TaxID=1028688 RepID=A0A0B6YRL6_9EUPU